MDKKKLIALVLSGALVVGMSACGSGGADDLNETAQQTAEETVMEEPTAPAEQAEPQQTEQQEVAEVEEVKQADDVEEAAPVDADVGDEPVEDVETEETEVAEPVVEVEAVEEPTPVETANTQPSGSTQQSSGTQSSSGNTSSSYDGGFVMGPGGRTAEEIQNMTEQELIDAGLLLPSANDPEQKEVYQEIVDWWDNATPEERGQAAH